jgi:hypothetical protein
MVADNHNPTRSDIAIPGAGFGQGSSREWYAARAADYRVRGADVLVDLAGTPPRFTSQLLIFLLFTHGTKHCCTDATMLGEELATAEPVQLPLALPAPDSEQLRRDEELARFAEAHRLSQVDAETIDELARLSRPDYDRVRKDEAEAMSIRVGTLDNEVDARRRQIAEELEAAATELPPVPPHWRVDPWPDPVTVDELINELVAHKPPPISQLARMRIYRIELGAPRGVLLRFWGIGRTLRHPPIVTSDTPEQTFAQ